VVAGRAVVLHDHRHDAIPGRQYGRAEAVNTGGARELARVYVPAVKVTHRYIIYGYKSR